MSHFFGMRFFKDSHQSWQFAQHTELDGTIHFTALKPDTDDKGEIKLMMKRQESSIWSDTAMSIPLQQDAQWRLKDILPMVNYDFQAVLVVDGKEIKKSEIISAIAPAHSIEIPLEINWKDLPNDVVSTSTTDLVGMITVNGIIPANAVIEVYALASKHYDDTIYEITPAVLSDATLLATVTKPTHSITWKWDQAKPLAEYMIVAVLKDNNNIIGSSDQLILADAGESDLEHVINSEAQPSAKSVLGLSSQLAQVTSQAMTGKGSINGTVTIQGPKQKDTSLLMLWRKQGESDYKVVNRYMYPSHRGTSWQWTDGVAGQKYEIMAALQVDDQNTSTAPNPILVTAPATKVDFNLNTWYTIPRTDRTPVNQVCIDKSADESTAVIVLPAIANAKQYWLRIGSDHNQAGVYNQKIPAGDGDLKVQVRVKNGKQNYMRYTYATCDHCSSDDNFAPPSDEVGFTCN